jgi:large subunit ribosomal protein L10
MKPWDDDLKAKMGAQAAVSPVVVESEEEETAEEAEEEVAEEETEETAAEGLGALFG